MGNDQKRGNRPGGNLMDLDALSAVWRDARCGHPMPVAAVNGLCAALACGECDVGMRFTLRFGRPKTFDVSLFDGADTPVGRASADAVRRFILDRKVGIMMPDAARTRTQFETMMLSILMGELAMGDRERLLEEPATDFEKMWKDVGCDHKNAVCQAYGERLTIMCSDCATAMSFGHAGGNKFIASTMRRPLKPVQCGPHDAEAVVRAVREHAAVLGLPLMMADRMSDDPERDAGRVAELILSLERHGLLERRKAKGLPYGDAVKKLSALSCTRAEFAERAVQVEAAMRAAGVACSENGKPIPYEQMMETMRLVWPCLFRGNGIKVDVYDPTGTSQFCVKCGFTTLDGAGGGSGSWKDGCPECGYAGYLMGMD